MAPRTIAERFSAATSTYDASAIMQRHIAELLSIWLKETIRSHCPHIPSPQTILELGCGTGFFTSHLRQDYPTAFMTATDISAAMLHICQNRLGDAKRMTFQVADAHTINIHSNWMVSSMCVQWLDHFGKLLEQWLSLADVVVFSTQLDGSFMPWRSAHEAHHLSCGLHACPSFDELDCLCTRLARQTGGFAASKSLTVWQSFDDGLAFARNLRTLGADQPIDRHDPIDLRPVLKNLNQPLKINHEIGFFLLTKLAR